MKKRKRNVPRGTRLRTEAAAYPELKDSPTPATSKWGAPAVEELEQASFPSGVGGAHENAQAMLDLLVGAVKKLATRIAPVLRSEGEIAVLPRAARSPLAQEIAQLEASVNVLTERVDL